MTCSDKSTLPFDLVAMAEFLAKFKTEERDLCLMVTDYNDDLTFRLSMVSTHENSDDLLDQMSEFVEGETEDDSDPDDDQPELPFEKVTIQ
jgi:hypothetical protein